MDLAAPPTQLPDALRRGATCTSAANGESPARPRRTIGDVAVPAGTAADVDAAVAAARAAFPGWAATAARRARRRARPPARRARRPRRRDRPHRRRRAGRAAQARHAGAGRAAAHGPSRVRRPGRPSSGPRRRIGNSLVVREPVGVVGAITPWNYPLHQVVAKVAPRSPPGCTVVLKPASDPADRLPARRRRRRGGPPGRRASTWSPAPARSSAQALAEHPDVDLVSFTGSTAVGRRIGATAAPTGQAGRAGARRQVRQRHPRRAPTCAKAVKVGVGNVLPQLRPDLHAPGPGCWCTASRYDEAVELAAAAAAATGRRPVRPGDPARPARLRRAAGPGARLHRQGRRRGRPARRRRPRRPGADARLLRRADRLRRRRPRQRRSRRRRSSARCCRSSRTTTRTTRVRDRQRHRVRAGRRGLGGRRGPRRGRRPPAAHRRRSTSTAAAFNPLAPFGGYKQSGRRPRARRRTASPSSCRPSRIQF